MIGKIIRIGVLVATVGLVVGVAGNESVTGAPLPTQPVCEITAKVMDTDIEYSTADTDWAREVGYERELSGGSLIEILSVQGEPVEEGYMSKETYCENQYPVGRQIMVISEETSQTGSFDETFQPGAIIKGNIQLFGDEFGGWYKMGQTQMLSAEHVVGEDSVFIEGHSDEAEETKNIGVFYATVSVIVVFLIGLLYFIKTRR